MDIDDSDSDTEMELLASPAAKRTQQHTALSTLPTWLRTGAQITCEFDGQKYQAKVLAISSPEQGFCDDSTTFSQSIQDKAESFGDQPGVLLEYLMDHSHEIIAYDDFDDRLGEGKAPAKQSTKKRSRSSSSQKKKKQKNDYDSDFVVDDDAVLDEYSEDEDDDDFVSRKRQSSSSSSKRKFDAFDDDDDDDEEDEENEDEGDQQEQHQAAPVKTTPLAPVVAAPAVAAPQLPKTTTTTTATNWLSSAKRNKKKSVKATKKTTTTKPAKRTKSSSYSTNAARKASEKDPYKFGAEFGPEFKRKKWTQDKAKELPGITEPQHMFDDMVSKVPELAKVGEGRMHEALVLLIVWLGVSTTV